MGNISQGEHHRSNTNYIQFGPTNSLQPRWKTASRTNREPVDDNATARALLVACPRRMGPPTTVVRSPSLLLLCAAPGETAAAAGRVPRVVPFMPLSSVATAGSVWLSDLPLFVGVDIVSGELEVRMKGDSILPMTMGAVSCW